MKTINLLLVFLAVMLLAACDNSKLSEGRYDITLVGKCLPGDSDNSFIFDEGVAKIRNDGNTRKTGRDHIEPRSRYRVSEEIERGKGSENEAGRGEQGFEA